MPTTRLPGRFVAVSRAMVLPAHPLLLPAETGPGRERECPQQQLWGLWQTRAPGAALLGGWEALSQELLQVQQLFKAGAQPWGSQRASLVPLGLETEWCGTFFLEWRQPGLALDLCVRETLCTGLFSSTPFLLQAVLSTAPVLVPEECAHRMCSLPVWYLHPPVDGGVVPALPDVCLPALWRMFPDTFVSTGAGSVGTCFFLEATKLGLSPVRSSVPATSSQTMSRSPVSTVLGKSLTVPQPLLLPVHSRKQQNPRNQSRC